jgi:hypothetical protein
MNPRNFRSVVVPCLIAITGGCAGAPPAGPSTPAQVPDTARADALFREGRDAEAAPIYRASCQAGVYASCEILLDVSDGRRDPAVGEFLASVCDGGFAVACAAFGMWIDENCDEESNLPVDRRERAYAAFRTGCLSAPTGGAGLRRIR